MIKVDNYDSTNKRYSVTIDTEDHLQMLKECGAIVRACYKNLIPKFGKSESKVWMRAATAKQIFYVDMGTDELIESQNDL